ncbi:predicted protein [Coccidioides posadasii str. Silveira]|uniref:Predicted protein n=1 Tax=Coccidioides posadasii (strain RMSCC 757 / Silveira) TaxID=443226 RepID=E9D9C1_COCPS|nr:predicted protein [Coccidioides posadasii str. Silveira]
MLGTHDCVLMPELPPSSLSLGGGSEGSGSISKLPNDASRVRVDRVIDTSSTTWRASQRGGPIPWLASTVLASTSTLSIIVISILHSPSRKLVHFGNSQARDHLKITTADSPGQVAWSVKLYVCKHFKFALVHHPSCNFCVFFSAAPTKQHKLVNDAIPNCRKGDKEKRIDSL